MKKPNFKVGDKVFAKVKGYPLWPARIIAENGKKYNVEFYGTGETGIIKVEDLFYYLKNKEKFQKPLKRIDYVDAFKQIEEAIKEDGGDGDNSVNADDSITDESNATPNVSNTSVDTPSKGATKGAKRKRSLSEKNATDATPTPKRTPARSTKSESIDQPEENKDKKEPESEIPTPIKQSPAKKSPKAKKDKLKEESQKTKEFEFVPIGENEQSQKAEDSEVIEKEETNEKTEDLDFKIEIVSEKMLKNNIAYAKHVKESEAYYKEAPLEPRVDYINQVLPVKLPSGIMGGIKLHFCWPLRFENEYERAIYDESVATRVLDLKLKVASGDQNIVNNHELFIPNIQMSPDDIKQNIYLKEIESKKARIARLKIETELAGLDAKIKNCLGLDKADPKEALQHLEAMCEIEFDDIMLKKHTHIVEMVRRLRKYVGNTKEWNMSEESLNEFSSWAEKVRAKAETVYSSSRKFLSSYVSPAGPFQEILSYRCRIDHCKQFVLKETYRSRETATILQCNIIGNSGTFNKVMKLPENCTSFWEGFMELVSKFRADCKDMTETQIYILCAEPRSRQAFLDRLDEVESEKENSSGVANAEVESSAVNGTNEVTAVDDEKSDYDSDEDSETEENEQHTEYETD